MKNCKATDLSRDVKWHGAVQHDEKEPACDADPGAEVQYPVPVGQHGRQLHVHRHNDCGVQDHARVVYLVQFQN